MVRRGTSWLFAGMIFFTGCLYPVSERIDGVVRDLALQPRDLQPIDQALSPAAQANEEKKAKPAERQSDVEKDELPAPKGRLNIPRDLLPGGTVGPLRLPPPNEENPAPRAKAIEQLYPPLPPLGDDPPDAPGPRGQPLCLTDLQQLAVANSPLVKQATARVEEARGKAIQAGLMPNPTVGFEADTIGTTGGAGYVGAFIEQTIKTSNKLQLSRAAAAFDIKLAELELVNTQADLATKIRGGYFAVLVAQESVRLNRALVRFTTDVYNLQVDQVRRGGFAAPYEPMYLRALATQARAALVQARNRRTSAWKQLAASMGLPGMPPTGLAGRIDVPVPAFVHQAVLTKALTSHTDIRSAEVSLAQAHVQLELERRTPIPDVNLRVMVQKDRTGPPFQNSPSVAVGFPIPVWDKNQGNILAAQAAIGRVGEDMHKARTELTAQLAEAFERYENNRVLLGYYRDQILPDLVRVYRGVYDRYQRDPGGAAGQAPAFTDVVVAQQNLAQAVGSYITALGGQWQAVVDVADVTQTFDLFGVEKAMHAVAEIPDLEKLPPLPCCHPCSPLPQAHQAVVDRGWPSAEPAAPTRLPRPAKTLPAPRPEKKGDKKAGARANFDPLLLEPPPVTSLPPAKAPSSTEVK